MPLGRITLDDHVAAFDVTQSPQFSKKQTRSIVAAVLADQVGGNDRGDDGDPTGLAGCALVASGRSAIAPAARAIRSRRLIRGFPQEVDGATERGHEKEYASKHAL